MNFAQTWRAKGTRFMHRYHARKAAQADVSTRFVAQQEPKTIGHFARGRQLIKGNFAFSGTQRRASGASIWTFAEDHPRLTAELHGFAWLDDLAAVGDLRARETAQAWVLDWIARYGDGSSDGWTPACTGRRIIRLIHHGGFLMRGQSAEISDVFLQSLGQQTLFLSKRWPTTPPGLARFEATTGMIIAGLALEGMAAHVMPAVTALSEHCASQIDANGGIPSRNPEELLTVFTLITWAHQALSTAGQTPPAALYQAMTNIAPTLRALRHADGSLARFHGGGRGLDGLLDHALADSKVRATPPDPAMLHMGFVRISAGRTSAVLDAAPPPNGANAENAHASTLALELTSGRRPLIVNCGAGQSFGPDWRRNGRSTNAHSTLTLDNMSSTRLGTGQSTRSDGPQDVNAVFTTLADGKRQELSHDGYRKTHGLTHARTIDIGAEGRGIVGEDILVALEDADKSKLDGHLKRQNGALPFVIRFHLHPDVDATVDLGGTAVSMILKSGEVWIFRCDATAPLALEPSVYLESGRIEPRATQQVVLSAAAIDYASRVRWSLVKAQDTPDALRDLVPNDLAGSYQSTSRGTS